MRFNDRTGETVVMKQSGFKATIIKYRSSSNIDVQFETGVILKNREYAPFASGAMRHPMIIECGEYATVINPNTKPRTVFYMDLEDLPLLGDSMWRADDEGYIRSGNQVKLHRLITNTPKGKATDHKDGNPANNCRYNLRVCTRQQNTQNRTVQANNKTGFKGINYLEKTGKWVSSIRVSGKTKHLGTFETPEEAARAYNAAATKYHGEYARLNEI